MAVVSARGAILVDEAGRELVDLSGGWSAAAVGYAHPRVIEAVDAAVRTMPGVGILSGTHRPGVELAERLLEMVPTRGDGPRAVYVGLAGSDANTAAIRAIRAWSDRPTILAFESSYHGGMGPSQQVSGLFAAEDVPTDSQVVLVSYGDLGAVSAALAGRDVAAVFVEPILSDGGLIIPPAEFLPGLRALCDDTGTLLVADEVKVGMGRTGRFLAHQCDGIEADLVSLGKSLGGGLPLSALIGPRAVLDSDAGGTLLTTAGNPVACAAGLAVLDIVQSERLAERAAALGVDLAARLGALLARHELVAAVRSRGLVGGIELRTADGRPARGETAKVVFRAAQLGAVLYYVGSDSNVLELTPPLVIEEEELARGLAIVSRAITDVETGLVDDAEVAAFAGW
ncbi:MAG: aspartate aminotransferase family protein [Leifsonia sp.]|nr:aspartate aminotransferase family protein [Leifsonia sp.]